MTQDKNELADAKRDVLREQIAEVLMTHPLVDAPKDMADNFRALADSIISVIPHAALPGTVQPVAVDVKPLEWHTFCSQSGNCAAAASLGEYIIQHEDALWELYIPHSDEHYGDGYPTLDAAKAAAQADFEARIRSSLIPATMAGDGGQTRKIYLASRYSRFPEMQKVREDLTAAGYTVTSNWINGGNELTKEGSTEAHEAERVRYAQEDFADLLAADCVISFTEIPRETKTRGGRHVEHGMALALGKRTIVVGHRENVFHCLPQCEFFADWSSALAALANPPLPGEGSK